MEDPTPREAIARISVAGEESTLLRHWVEVNADPVHDVIAAPALLDRLLGAAPATPGGGRLEAMARAYGDLLEPLFPLWHDFVVACLAVKRTPALMLRDALQFWPFFEALGVSPWFLAYSRKDERRGAPPRWLNLQRSGNPTEEPLVVDTGIYGTLLASLIESGVLLRPAAMFLTTRNPNVFGHTNARIEASILAGAVVDPEDAIRLCDTAESLLKAFEIVDGGLSTITATTPNAAACALTCELFRRAFKYGLQRGRRALSDAEWANALSHAKSEPSWFRHDPVPAWEEGLHFVERWRHGALAPLEGPQGLRVGAKS